MGIQGQQTTLAGVEFSLKDGVRDFMADVAVSQANGSNEVEAPLEVIKHFMPQGLGESEYFWFQGVKVYEKGKKEESQKREAQTLEEINFPKKSGAV